MSAGMEGRENTGRMDKIHIGNDTKKDDLTECKNYRTIALISHMAKVLLVALLNRLKAQIEKHLADEQAGFRKDRNTRQQILTLRLIEEKAKRKGRLVYNCFIDFQKAFDSIKHDITWTTLDHMLLVKG